MKIKAKVISRNQDDYVRETKYDLFKAPKNYNAPKDSFQPAVEYSRAMNATKLSRVFAKPFMAALDGHNEGVHILTLHPTCLSTLLSGARDGQVKVWNMATKKCYTTLQAHNGVVTGVSIDNQESGMFVTVGSDAQLKHWKIPDQYGKVITEPEHSIALSDVPHGVSHIMNSTDFVTCGEGIHVWKVMRHIMNSTDFVTCGEGIHVWKVMRDSPIRTYNLGVNTIHSVKCNPIESSVMAGCSSDRSIFVLDNRQKAPLSKVVLALRTNTIAWHPLESYTFTAANDDYNLYTFDMRYLSSARNVHFDHIAAVTDVDYSPTGQEFVSGSFDRAVRIFPVESARSREVYHAPRMQNVLSVKWSLDSKYVMCGSEEMNIRIWKADASEKLGTLLPREKAAMAYNKRLRETYQHHPEIRRIERHRQVPKYMYNAKKEHATIRQSQKRKQENRRKHAKEGEFEDVAVREKSIIKHGMD
uniref:DDB1- and CUL4-associated factor 13 n=1 Tax=Steinernema glaseri TaxID=37863 RepID=A0A1I7YMH1_9BILA